MDGGLFYGHLLRCLSVVVRLDELSFTPLLMDDGLFSFSCRSREMRRFLVCRMATYCTSTLRYISRKSFPCNFNACL